MKKVLFIVGLIFAAGFVVGINSVTKFIEKKSIHDIPQLAAKMPEDMWKTVEKAMVFLLDECRRARQEAGK